MTRMLTVILAGLVLSMALGCESSDPADAEMKEKRPVPEKRAAPGSQLGSPEATEGEEGEAPPPPGGG